MKVAILVDELPVSSMRVVLGEESHHLRELGISCDPYVIMGKSGESPIAHEDSVRVRYFYQNCQSGGGFLAHRLPTFSFLAPYYFLPPTGPARKLAKALEDYDVVLAHLASTALFLSWLKLRRPRLVYYCWDPLEYILDGPHVGEWSRLRRFALSGLGKAVDRFLYKSSDLVVLPSKFHLPRVASALPTSKIRVVYPGVHREKITQSSIGTYGLVVGRMEPGKKPFQALEVLRRASMKAPDIRVVFVGPWQTEQLKSAFLTAASAAGLSQLVVLKGALLGNELAQVYAGARCLLHFRSESFGFTALEAAAHGVPMIVPKESGVSELFSPGVHGYFPPEDDIEGFATALVTLWRQTEASHSMGAACVARAESMEWSRHAADLANCFETIL